LRRGATRAARPHRPRFAAAPSAFRVRAWNPVVPCASSPLRLLELYVVAGGALADMCVEVLYSTHLRVFAAGGALNPAHLNDLEHGGMFFLFGALALSPSPPISAPGQFASPPSPSPSPSVTTRASYHLLAD